MKTKTREEVIEQIQNKITKLEAKECYEPSDNAQMQIAISNLYKALTILYSQI